MTTYTTDFTYFARPGYAYTYVLIDYVEGTVFSVSCESAACALRRVYHRMDGMIRLCRLFGNACNLVLANCNTGKVVAEVKCDFSENRIAHLYDMMEGR